MTPGYRLEGDVIYLDRELNELDFFVRDFLSVLSRYTSYLIVSGYVSISTGRTRGTEDVDVLVPKLNKDKFCALFKENPKKGLSPPQGDGDFRPFSITDFLK